MGRWVAAWLVLTLALLAWRWPVLSSPPYWDYVGMWREAMFLADSNFDYDRLIHDEDDVFSGGTKTYVTSVIPTLVAVALKTLPSVKAVLTVYHVTYIALGAGILLVAFRLLRPRAGTLGAALVVAALLTTPLFIAQLEMLGMEFPVSLLGLAALLLVTRERFKTAAVCGLAAFFCKATGALFVAAAAVHGTAVAAYAWLTNDAQRARNAFIGAIVNAATFGTTVLLMRWGGVMAKNIPQVRATGFAIEYARFWCPDLLILAGLAVVLTIAWYIVRVVRFRVPAGVASLPAVALRLLHPLVDEPRVWLCAMVIVASVLSILKLVFVPRYFVVGTPLLWVLLGTLLFSVPRARQTAWIALAVMIGLNLYNQHGALFPAMTTAGPGLGRMGCFLERSREYWADHQSMIDATGFLAANFPAGPVVSPGPCGCFLTRPLAGYVPRPVPVYQSETMLDPGSKRAIDLLVDMPADLILLHIPRARHVNCQLQIPPPDEDDLVLWTDHLPQQAIIYRRRNPDGSTCNEADWQEFYIEHLYEWFDPQRRTMLTASALLRAGRTERAQQLLEGYLEQYPHDVTLLAMQAGIHVQQHDFAAAVACAQRAVAADPQQAEAHDSLGAAWLAQGEVTQALGHFDAALRCDRNYEKALTHRASCLLQLGRTAEAEQAIEAALAVAPDSFDANLQLGLLRMAQDRRDDAETALRRALKVNPLDADTNRALATLAQARKDMVEFEARLRALVARMPDDAGALRTLGDLALERHEFADACRYYHAALAARPELIEARASLAIALQQAGDAAEAVQRYRQVLHVLPTWQTGLNNLAWLLATHPDPKLRNGSESVSLAESACRQTQYKDPGYLDTLAAAYAELGDFPKAVQVVRQALALPSVAQDAARQEKLRSRLSLYENRQPYRQPLPASRAAEQAADQRSPSGTAPGSQESS
ncbi:MAG: tetratricopeptide repeat protein [Pirellulales bacterium]|nr:tetratricopeptide repeat protein [Pirellulales bacterium]